MTIKHYLGLLAFGLALGMTGCGEAEQIYDCAEICDSYSTCIDNDVSEVDCTSACESHGDEDMDFAAQAERVQAALPLNPAGLSSVSPEVSFNAAVSFATNTNWQAYGGETTMSHLTQMLGLAVQNFVSAAPPSASTPSGKGQGTQSVITPKPSSSPSANETFLKTMAAARKQACSVLCEKTAPLKCGAEAQCAEGCFESFNLPVCVQEMEQFLTCSTNAPLSDFVCDPGTSAAALKDGVCDAEQANIIRCMSQSLDPTPAL